MKKASKMLPAAATIRKVVREEIGGLQLASARAINDAMDRIVRQVQTVADTYALQQARQEAQKLMGRNNDLLAANLELQGTVRSLQQILHGGAQEALRKALVGAVTEVREQIGAQE